MKAILTRAPGGREQLYMGEHSIPSMFKHELKIKVQASGVNRADILQREGKYPPPKGESPIIGLEVSGLVEKVGEDCTGFQKGDKVMALLAGGGYGEYVAVHQDLVIPVPDQVDLIDAAGIPEVFITAYQVLFKIANLKSGEWVLIHAGASGVGTAAIQLCKAVGANCIATVRSNEKVEFCESLGADVAINTATVKYDKRVLEVTDEKGVNIILDPVGAAYFEKNLAIAALDCRWVLIAGMGGVKIPEFNLAKLLIKRVALIGSTLRSRDHNYKSQLVKDFSDQFLNKFGTGELKPIIDSTFDVKDVAEGHAYMETNRNMGKIILNWP
ncbi:MAG: NAD(P)H-quinone oxidoreductase [Bacteroidota bacterium]